MGACRDPARHLGDRDPHRPVGASEDHDALVPAGCEVRAIGAVACTDYKFEWLRSRFDYAVPEFGLVESAADKVGAVKLWVGAGYRGSLGRYRFRRGEVEYRNREVGEGVGDAGVPGPGYVYTVATVVNKGGS